MTKHTVEPHAFIKFTPLNDPNREECVSDKGNSFKVLRTTKGWVWTPISCFLASNWRGPWPTKQEAIDAGKVNW